MKILDFLEEDRILIDLKGSDKISVLKELSSVLLKPCQFSSAEELVHILIEREKLESTVLEKALRSPTDV